MPINRDFIGRAYPGTTTYEVSREVIRRFAEAIGDDNPLCLDAAAARAAGHADVVAPPTFLIATNGRYGAGSPVEDPAFGVDYSRVVHGEQRFTLHRPVVAGDVLLSTSRVVEVRDIGTNELAAIEQEITDEAGRPVATLWSSLVSRGTAAPRMTA